MEPSCEPIHTQASGISVHRPNATTTMQATIADDAMRRAARAGSGSGSAAARVDIGPIHDTRAMRPGRPGT